MKIYFDDNAICDLEDIYLWIASDSVKAARAVDRRLRETIRRLATFPRSGRPGLERTRELIVPRLPYVVVYEVDFECGDVVIKQVVHMARNRFDAP